MMESLFATSVKRSYACSGWILSIALLTCGVALMAISVHWDLFTSNDKVFYEIVDDSRNVVGVKNTVALLWSCFLLWPSCIVGMGLACVRKKSVMVLLITTAAIACIGSIVSTVKSQNVYREIQELTGGDRGDYDDDRCEDNSYNDINYCECEIKHGQMPNETRIARFQVNKCEDVEKISKRTFLFFVLSLMASCLSAALFLMATFAFCSPSEHNLLNQRQQQQQQDYNSIKSPDQSMNYKQEIGFSNPIFAHCNDGGQKKTVFWYPYSGAPDSGNQNANEKLQYADQQNKNYVTCSRFSKNRLA